MSKFKIVRRKISGQDPRREVEFYEDGDSLGSIQLFPKYFSVSPDDDEEYISINVEFLSPYQARKVAAELLRLAEEAES